MFVGYVQNELHFLTVLATILYIGDSFGVWSLP